MRVLVGAVRADDGATSEGLCTARVARLLAERGHEVRLLVGTPTGAVGLGPAVEVHPVALPETMAARVGRRAANGGRRFRADLPVQATTGHGLDDRALVAAWCRTLAAHEQAFAPDVTVVRGAGLEVHPLLAAASRRSAPVPLVTHLHDPWPLSWYPPSYAASARLVSRRQEAAARRVLRAGHAITAPSARLFDWMAEHSGVALAPRAHVVPHLGLPAASRTPPVGLLPDRPFVLCHAGTLLGPRDPAPLLEAVDRVVAAQPGAGDELGVALLGSVDRRHRQGAIAGRVAAAVRAGTLVVHDERVAQPDAASAVAASAVGVVIEAPDTIDPFLPAKLSDLLAGGRPVLALSPRASATADLLGADHPLRAGPDDVDAIAHAVARAWSAWREGSLDELRPPAASVAAVGPDAVGAALDRALDAAVSRAAQR